jgi:hypothetical protein
MRDLDANARRKRFQMKSGKQRIERAKENEMKHNEILMEKLKEFMTLNRRKSNPRSKTANANQSTRKR